MKTVRLTAAQAMVRFLSAQRVEIDGREQRLFEGVFAIFGHGNVAGLGEALYGARDQLPTYRAHNEQAMAHAAIAFAKASRRRRMMACTTSIGPGATNMITAAAVAHVNRLPVLLIPGDVFANRKPDPVLQQVEDFGDGTASANDCFRPVSRYFDRITRPEQIVPALTRALAVLTDPAECGPATLAFCQDVQTEAYDYPLSFFEERVHRLRRIAPDPREVAVAADLLTASRKPFVVCGGGVLYSDAERELIDFCARRGIPVAETQAGKSAMPADHPLAVGAVGVTGTGAANALASEADVIVGVGTRFADFTTGSWALFKNPDRRFIGVNVQPFDAAKHRAAPVVGDARAALAALDKALGGWTAAARVGRGHRQGQGRMERDRRPIYGRNKRPAADRRAGARRPDARGPGERRVVCAAGGLPGELHKLWRPGAPLGYHVEYGYSCMGYEIAGGLGVKLATPDTGSRRGARRRLLSDDEFGDRDVGDAGPEAHHRRQRQSRLRLHQPPAAGDRRRAIQQSAERRAARGLARGRFRRACPLDGSGRGQGRLDRRTRGRVQGGPRGEIDPGHRHRHRSLRLDGRGRVLVGRRRARRLGARGGRRRAPSI